MAVPILMYHSLSATGPGPVSLDPATFRDQMAVLRDAGATGISVSEYVAATQADGGLPDGSVVLTFDDGYRDFAEVAFPVLQTAGWRATVFLPAEPLQSDRPWNGGDGHPRRLLTWPMVEELARQGIEFGGHSLTHRDLTRLTSDDAAEEIGACGRRIHERAGCVVQGFAPPFGRSTPALRREIARHYRWSVGTRMARADADSDRFDLPRIEMWYFRSVRRWRRYVARGWTPYFELRRTLRAIRRP